MYAVTTDPLKSPVFPSELVNWARLDEDDPTIDSLLIAATHAAITFLKLDLLTRTWSLTYKDWPTFGTPSMPTISRSAYSYNSRVELPYTNLISVDTVTVNGEASTDYLIVAGRPAMLQFNSFGLSSDDSDALIVTYKAGFGTNTADVPDPIRKAIMMIATYMHSHNGMCDAGDALAMSGAKAMLVPYAVKAGITI